MNSSLETVPPGLRSAMRVASSDSGGPKMTQPLTNFCAGWNDPLSNLATCGCLRYLTAHDTEFSVAHRKVGLEIMCMLGRCEADIMYPKVSVAVVSAM